MLGGLAVFLASYAVYAFFLGGIDGLPVLPEVYWPVAGNGDSYDNQKRAPEGEIETKMKQAFGNESPEAKYPIKLNLRSKGLFLAAKDFKIEDGRVKLTTFSAAVFAMNKGDSPFPEINTVQSEVAYLTLDQEVTNITELSKRKINGVELSGSKVSGVKISNNRRSAEKTDDIDLYVTGDSLFYDATKNLISTNGFVQLQDNKTQPPIRITAKGMEIKLSDDSGPNRPKTVTKAKEKEETVTGVEMVFLKSNVEMHLYVEANSPFLAGTSEDVRAKPATGEVPEKSHVVVKTNGTFHYDLPNQRAWFDSNPGSDAGTPAALDQVLVLREHKVGDTRKNDQLLCEHLELKFRKKTDIDPKTPHDPQSELEIESALATAKELVLAMDTENLVAHGEELHYRGPTANAGPQTILKGSPMRAVKDGNEIKAGELHLIGADKKGNGQQALARGPGQIDIYDKSNPNKATPSRAVFRDGLITVKERDGDKLLDVLTMTGDASFVDEEHKRTLSGQRLQVWIESERPGDAGAGRAAGATSGARQKVRRIEAFERASLRTLEFIIHQTNHLTVLVKNEPLAGTQLPEILPPTSGPSVPPPPVSGSGARIGPPQLGAPVADTPNLIQVPTKSRKPIELTANEVVAYMSMIGDKPELQALDCEGAVHVHQEGEDSPGGKSRDKGMDIRGAMLSLSHHPRGDTLVVFGDSQGAKLEPAKLELGELVIVGPKVTINQKDNKADVEGAGAMSMPSKTPFEGGKMQSGKTQIKIWWNKDMFFTGKYAEFRGGVQAVQDSAALKCQELTVILDRVVSFKEGQKENQEAQVEKLLCDGKVWVMDDKRDPTGKRVQFDRLVATQLTVDNQEGPIIANGPGRFEHLAQGSADVLAPESRPQDADRKDAQVMKITRVNYDGRMFSNNKDNTRNSKFYDNVQVFHFPTEDENAQMNPDSPPKEGFYMKCNILNVFTRQIDNKSSQLMKAEGNVFFRTQEFFGTAAVVKYDEGQEQVIFEGTSGNPAALYRKAPGRAQPQEIKGGKILYNRKTGIFHLDGVKVITAWRDRPDEKHSGVYGDGCGGVRLDEGPEREQLTLKLETGQSQAVTCVQRGVQVNRTCDARFVGVHSSLQGWARIAKISSSLACV
jgi:hypothetical protein